MNLLKAIQQTTVIPEHYNKLTNEEMEDRVRELKNRLGKRLFIPGHHYQRDEVIQFADAIGDSFKLARISANNKEAEYIVFCGVHFMAETADILTAPDQKVILPDRKAGCSMADMADIHQTERAWNKLQNWFGDTVLPLTYVNSTAEIKAFVGRNGGATVTSSNAHKILKWGFSQKERILFLPDQHLGRNTAYDLGVDLHQMALWDPLADELDYEGDLNDVKVILWKGHCSVHENFTIYNVREVRKTYPDINIIVHPECRREVVEAADSSGSTNYIIQTIENAAPGTSWAIGTEMNLVSRLIKQHPDKHIISLNPHFCPCMTMNRIDLPHLLWSLESIDKGDPINQIKVSEQVAAEAKLALERMLALS
ncbi:MAG: quinolinate synthase NadA [Bacillales bacterium]|nr:quinolinate synthase NadA [Bacillales bacterium]